MTEQEIKDFCVASEQGDADTVAALLKRGVNVNAIHPDNGRTALFYAAEQDQRKVIKMLLKAGADPNIQENNDGIDFKGETALFAAGRAGNNSAMKEILKSGRCDVNIRNCEGSTAADVTPGLELKRQMIEQHGLVKRERCTREPTNPDWVWHHCLWMTNYEGESLLEPSTKRVRRSQVVIDSIELRSKSLVQLIETCFKAGFHCDCIDEEYYDRLFLAVQLQSPRICDMLMAQRKKPSAINVEAILKEVDELYTGDDLEEARMIYKGLIWSIFPIKLQALCRIAILKCLPTGLVQRQRAIDAMNHLPETLKKYLIDFN